jgi:hypothetical protein
MQTSKSIAVTYPVILLVLFFTIVTKSDRQICYRTNEFNVLIEGFCVATQEACREQGGAAGPDVNHICLDVSLSIQYDRS